MGYEDYKWTKGQANWHIEHNNLCDKLAVEIPPIQTEITEGRGGHSDLDARADSAESRLDQIESFLEGNSAFDPQDPCDLDLLASWLWQVQQHAQLNDKELSKFRKVIFQSGTAIIPTASGWFKTDYAAVSLDNAFVDSDYLILTEITGDPAEVGQVKVYDKATNGFKLTNTGSGAAIINWMAVKLSA